jgi:hypothetical protein
VAPVVGEEAGGEDGSAFKMQKWSRVHGFTSLPISV